jgi:hypothetical protein
MFAYRILVLASKKAISAASGEHIPNGRSDERYTEAPRGTHTLTPMKQHPEYDEERLDTLQSIRAAFLDLAEAGDEGAAGVVRAVDAMIAEVEEWIRLS